MTGVHLVPEGAPPLLGRDIIDISWPITPEMITWEDRFQPEVQWHSATARGDRTTNTTWRLNSHTGTHADAPLHHLAGGHDVTAIPLDSSIGPCRVLDLTDAPGAQLRVEDLRPHEIVAGERLLLRTRTSVAGRGRSDGRFDPDYVALSDEAATWLVQREVRLVGTDALAIEPYGHIPATVHQTLLTAEITILEGLCLGHVRAGSYFLLFLPLPLVGAEAAPGRAVLMPLDNKEGPARAR